MSEFVITAQNLGKRFNSDWIIRGFSDTLESGNVYAVVGPNGSGKSTLLQLLWGQLPPTQGTITYAKSGEMLDVDLVYKHLSIAAPYLDLVEEFTLEESVEFHFRLKPKLKNWSTQELLELMELSHARQKPIAAFSSGMKQRVKLGLALFSATALLILDEPGTNLDKSSLSWYLTKLEEYGQNRLVIIASNQPEEYPAYSKKVEILQMK